MLSSDSDSEPEVITKQTAKEGYERDLKVRELVELEVQKVKERLQEAKKEKQRLQLEKEKSSSTEEKPAESHSRVQKKKKITKFVQDVKVDPELVDFKQKALQKGNRRNTLLNFNKRLVDYLTSISSQKVEMFLDHIFHEKQEGQLCAQHCVNNLLQGPYFTPTDLSSIAQQLDQQELDTLAGTQREEFKSHNYDDSGFFSVQVVEKALQIWNLELIPIRSTNPIAVHAKQSPESCTAFICNLEEHWFTLRRFGNSPTRWYNLNSVYKKPMYVTETYLGMLLQQLQTEGYSIFVVNGELPISRADDEAFLAPVPLLEEKETEDEEGELQKAIKMSLGEDQDDDLQQALKMSMMDAGVDEESMRMAIAASLSEAPASGSNARVPEQEDDLQKALRMSMMDTVPNETSVQNVIGSSLNGEPPLPRVKQSNPRDTTADMDEIRRKRLERFS